MNDKSNAKTKADLYAMLAEAVRNIQPQPELVREVQSMPKRRARIKRVQPAKKKRRH